jgi:hypothetical protein
MKEDVEQLVQRGCNSGIAGGWKGCAGNVMGVEADIWNIGQQ